MSRLPLRRVPGCVLLLGLAAGCADRDHNPPAETATLAKPAMGDACGLITKPEVDAILGASVTLRPDRKTGWSQCTYEAPGGAGFSMKVFWSGGEEELTVTKSAMSIAPGMLGDNGVESTGMMALKPVADLGEEAYFNPIVGSYVRQGDVLLEFDLRLLLFHAASREAAVEQWRALAEKALARL